MEKRIIKAIKQEIKLGIIMEDNFDYQSVPYSFAHCFNSRCPKGEKMPASFGGNA